jgi:hypothetical protein
MKIIKKASSFSSDQLAELGLTGIPSDWPVEIYDEHDLSDGFEEISDQDLDHLKSDNQANYDEWYLAKTAVHKFVVNLIELTDEQNNQLTIDNKARDFSSKLTAVLKVFNQEQGMNLAQSLWAHHRIRALEIVVTQDLANSMSVFTPLVGQTIVIDALNLVISGDVETAYFVFAAATPDDGTQAYHALTSEFMGFMRNQIGIYLGWEEPT